VPPAVLPEVSFSPLNYAHNSQQDIYLQGNTNGPRCGFRLGTQLPSSSLAATRLEEILHLQKRREGSGMLNLLRQGWQREGQEGRDAP
jgi:hypothetical protein